MGQAHTGWVAKLIGVLSCTSKRLWVRFPIKGMYPSCGFDPRPWSGLVWEAINQCVSLT